MDYDAAFNITAIQAESILPHHSTADWVQQIIFIIFFAIGISADVIVIYAIYQFRRLRSISYMFILNWVIADLCCLLVTPSGYRIIYFLRYRALPENLWCFLEETGATLHVNLIVCVIITTLDWFLGAHFRRASEKFRNYYKFVIGFIWVLAISESITVTTLCINKSHIYIHQELQIFLLYSLIVLMIIISQISRLVQKCRKMPLEYPTLNLTLATAFVICSVFSIIGLFVTSSRRLGFETAATCLLFSSSVVNISLLYNLDKDFHACLHQLFKCSGNRYEEHNCDINDTLNFQNPSGDIRFSFDNNTEQLLQNVD